MNVKETLEQMKQLDLHGMYSFYLSQLELPIHNQLQGADLVAQLVQNELLHRTDNRTARYLKTARLRDPALPELVDCNTARNLTQQQFNQLLEGNYIKKGQHVLITGATGCGKSYVACALAHQACAMGYRTLYLNMNQFYENVMMAKHGNTYNQLMGKYKRFHVIILDDFGLEKMNEITRMALYSLLEGKHLKGSLIVTAQVPVANWYDLIGEPTIADAICDRLTAKAHRIELKGDSRRRIENQ